MTIALWIIAICEVIRALQNAVQLLMLRENKKPYENACSEFVKSLKMDDREMVKNLLKEFDEQNSGKEFYHLRCVGCSYYDSKDGTGRCTNPINVVDEDDYCSRGAWTTAGKG